MVALFEAGGDGGVRRSAAPVSGGRPVPSAEQPPGGLRLRPQSRTAAPQGTGQKVRRQAAPPISEKQLVLGTVSDGLYEMRADANVATIMHEAAHQMSFNTGMLNREGDQPLWLAEGLATYCEATELGHWKGIGRESGAGAGPGGTPAADACGCCRCGAGRERQIAARPQRRPQRPGRLRPELGMFRMLIDEQPKALRRYCELIYGRGRRRSIGWQTSRRSSAPTWRNWSGATAPTSAASWTRPGRRPLASRERQRPDSVRFIRGLTPPARHLWLTVPAPVRRRRPAADRACIPPGSSRPAARWRGPRVPAFVALPPQRQLQNQCLPRLPVAVENQADARFGDIAHPGGTPLGQPGAGGVAGDPQGGSKTRRRPASLSADSPATTSFRVPSCPDMDSTVAHGV